jgi:chemotaxis response regulator CheB
MNAPPGVDSNLEFVSKCAYDLVGYERRSGRGKRVDAAVETDDIVVVGASAGGVPSLKALASTLPTDFPGSLFVVVDMSTETLR